MEDILKFLDTAKSSPFMEGTICLDSSIFRTKDAKNVQARVINSLSKGFVFPGTRKIWEHLTIPPENKEKVFSRQGLFSGAHKDSRVFLRQIKKPKPTWKQPYSLLLVTEDQDAYNRLKGFSAPSKFIASEEDLRELADYDIVQAVSCEQFENALASMQNVIVLNSADDAYMEQYLSEISGWKENIQIIERIESAWFKKEFEKLNHDIGSLFLLLEIENIALSETLVEKRLEDANKRLLERLSKLTLSGENIYHLLSGKAYPQEVRQILSEEISRCNLPQGVLVHEIPIKIDQNELERHIAEESEDRSYMQAMKIMKNSKVLKSVPAIQQRLSSLLMIEDFLSSLPQGARCEISDTLNISKSYNMLLDDPAPISFYLDSKNRCSILTGANSGGKTTLLEHILQIITLSQLGIDASGDISVPLFSQVYYFAKNKGSSNKGAFETLLGQMDKIKAGEKTIILADEIESVTEPGVAAEIISSTAEFFIEKGCFLVIATHLGQEIAKKMPKNSRVDGIEAKGLDSDFNLIVDHSPVLGRLATSTPELIVEHLAKTKKTEYYIHINRSLANRSKKDNH
ncbi:MAG: hypothetical protein HGA85_02135 [Nanoarchaeota archaeon]|nr:hypothetical protein [Nanoarchaeota archaeon]